MDVAGTWPLLFAAGSVALADAADRAPRTALVVAVITGLVALPMSTPLLPLATYKASGLSGVNPELAEEVGWPDLTHQVTAAYDSIPASQRPDARVITHNYGEAGALQLYGPALGLPRDSVLSGQNSYADWWPDGEPSRATILVAKPGDKLEHLFDGCRRVGRVDNKEHLDNKARGETIVLCQEPNVPPAVVRRAARHRS